MSRFCSKCGTPQTPLRSGFDPPSRPSTPGRDRNYAKILLKLEVALALGIAIFMVVFDQYKKAEGRRFQQEFAQEAAQKLHRISSYLPSIQEEASGHDSRWAFTSLTVLKGPPPTIASVLARIGLPDFIDDKWGLGTEYAHPATRCHYLIPGGKSCWEPRSAKPTQGGNRYLEFGGCVPIVVAYTFVFVDGRLDALVRDDGIERTTWTTTTEHRSKLQRVESSNR